MTPLTVFQPGQQVRLLSHRDKILATAYVNPRTLIAARILQEGDAGALQRAFVVKRLRQAVNIRERLYSKPFYRMVYGEGDYFPGLIIDRYDRHFVVQCNTAGIDCMASDIIDVLVNDYVAESILLRNDTSARALEGLPQSVTCVHGQVPDPVVVYEQALSFEVSLTHGQKTGWFFDQRANRERLAPYVRGKRVLDLFSYVGSWGVHAAVAGAAEVLCVDSSQDALEKTMINAQRNAVGATLSTCKADVFDALERLHAEGRRFDVVLCDPPAFIKRKKDLEQGKQGYLRLNRLAMQVLSDDGILVSSSCSYHLSGDDLRGVLTKAARELHRSLQVLEQSFAGPDHPVHPAIVETAYLKCFYCRVLR